MMSSISKKQVKFLSWHNYIEIYIYLIFYSVLAISSMRPIHMIVVTGETSSSQPSSQRPFVTKSSSMGPLGSAANSQVAVNKLVKPDLNSNPVRAAAVAAGARVATQSDAASLLKAAQAKSTVHVIPAAASSKSSMPVGASSHSDAHPNVHFNDLAAAPFSTHPVVSSNGPQLALEKASSPTTLPTPISGATVNISELADAELQSKQNAETTGEMKILSEDVTKEQVEEQGGLVSGNVSSEQVQVGKAALLKPEAEFKTQLDVVQSSNASLKVKMGEKDMMDGDKSTCLTVGKDENQSAVKENGDNQSTRVKQADLPSMATDECIENFEAVSKAKCCNVITAEEG